MESNVKKVRENENETYSDPQVHFHTTGGDDCTAIDDADASTVGTMAECSRSGMGALRARGSAA
jgi:hypothetical protein